ncbi:MAG: MMPL family transporter [Spirochaetaceae bacterium]
MNKVFKSVANFIVNFPVLIIGVTLIALVTLGFGASRLKMDSDMTDDIPSTIPEKAFYDEVGKIFPADDALIIALTDEDGAFSPGSLRQVYEWSNKIKDVEDVKSILSLSTASLITGNEYGIVIENTMEFLPVTPTEIASFKKRMDSNEMGGALVGRDGKASAMMIGISTEADIKNRPRYIINLPKLTTDVEMNTIKEDIMNLTDSEGLAVIRRIYSSGNGSDEFDALGSYNQKIGLTEKNIVLLVVPEESVITPLLLIDITSLVEQKGGSVNFSDSQVAMYDRMSSIVETLPKYSKGKVYISGSKAVSSVVGKLMMKDLSVLFPIVILIIIVVLFLSFRTFRGVLLPLTNVLMATVMAMGFMGWANQPISMATMILPIILIAVGTAYAIHVLNRYYEELTTEDDKKKAIVLALEHVAVPTLLAAITTMIGFASLAISSITALRIYGLLAALGILFALILAVSFTPAVLVLLKKTSIKNVKSHENNMLSKILEKIGKFVSTKPKLTLSLCLVVIIIAATGIPKILFETNSVESFKKSTEIRQSSEYLNDNFTGITILNVIVQAEEEGAILDPEILKAIDDLQRDFEKLRFEGKTMLLPGDKGYDTAEDLIGGTQSIATFIRGINKAMHADDPAWDKVPDFETEVAVTTEKYVYNDGVLQEIDSDYLDVLETFIEGDDFIIEDGFITMERYGMQRRISLPEGTSVDLIPGRVYAGQLVFQYENSGDPENIEAFIDNPRKTAQINIFIRTGSSTVSNQIEKYTREYIKNNFPDSAKADITGLSALNLTIMRLLTNTQISSVIASLVIILFMISLINRSVVEGLFSIIPLTASLIINFGIMGLFAIPVDISTATIASIAIGIGIDYTLHFLERFKIMAKTMEHGIALQTTLKTTGRGIIYNAIAVAGGFLALMFSQIKGNFYMGLLMAIIMVVASTFAIILLPAVIMIVKPKFITNISNKEKI